MASQRWIAGKYELLEPVGQGGMAKVWRGVTHGAAGFTCRVAIKRVLPKLAADTAMVAMFVEEARVVSQLSHPNIVQVHDFDQDDEGRYFIVMEWVDGLDLGAWISSFEKSPTPSHLVAAIGVEILRALASAHERVDGAGRPAPVIHRDISPTNVLLARLGIVKLADFGLARAADRAAMTQPGIVKGKLSYLAPELLHGQPATVRSDLFGVAVVLWEALAGRTLFASNDTAEVLRNVTTCEIPSLKALRPDLPAALVEVIHTALAKSPTERFESAAEMQRALATILRGQTEPTDDRAIARSVEAALARLPNREEAEPDPGAPTDPGKRPR